MMTTENEPLRNAHDPYASVKAEVIDSIVAMDDEQRRDFEANYFGVNKLIAKYRLARDLILDGRFPNPVGLFESFVHPQLVIPNEYKSLATPLRERLHFLLIQKGVLEPNTMEHQVAERLFRGELERRQNIKDLIEEGWPIEVIGQLMTVDLFSEITDAKKLEEYRAWTTRGIMSEYVGVTTGKTPRKELSIPDILGRIPDRVFVNPTGIKFHLIEHYIEQRLMRGITDAGLQEGLATIESLIEGTDNPDKRTFIQQLSNRFYDIATYPLDASFNQTVSLKGQEKAFPSFEQRTFCYDFIYHKTRLLAAETGLGKTGTAYLAMENSDAEKVLVLAPASGKATWAVEDQKLFKEPGNVFIVDGSQDITAAIASDKKYIVVSQELLGLTEHDPVVKAKLEALVSETGIDGAIIDEIDNLNNPLAISTKAAASLLETIQKNFADKHQQSPLAAPVIGLTATPIRSRLSDLNVTMGLLYPDDYALSHATATTTRKTFSDAHLNRPDLAYFSLIGEKRMFRWEQATGVQEFRYEILPVSVSPFEDYLYTFIANEIPTDQLNKIRILEDALFNPLLIKAEVRALARGNIPTFDIDQTMRRLHRVVEEWKRERNITTPITDDDFLSADRLVELGLGDVVLATFFSDLLENGIDTLVDELTQGTHDAVLKELRTFWKPREISTKYSVLRQIVQDALTWRPDDNGVPSRQKVFLVSPSRKQGRTGNVLQRELRSANGDSRNLYAQYELDTINDARLSSLLKDWTEGLCREEDILVVDGSITVGKARDQVIARWVDNPDTAVLLVTLEATYQSRDYTLNRIQDEQGRHITGVRKIFLAPPWHYQHLKQMGGRSQRQGQLVPVDVGILQSQDLIDQGKAEAVLYTYLLSRMALSGIVLSPDEQAFFDSMRLGNKISLQSPESRFMRDSFAWLRGAGEDEMADYFTRESRIRDEVTHEQLIAEKFFDDGKDAYHITGYNAEMVAYLIKKLASRDSTILSVGAGTLLLQRKLAKGIDNIDMNGAMMDAGWTVAQQYGGRKITARASKLDPDIFPDQTYDIVDSAFALDWSRLNPNATDVTNSERVRILSQMQRVLKPGGYLILTLPEKSLDDARLKNFTKVLEEHFGFCVDQQFSGKSFGRNKMGLAKPLGWCIVAQKQSDIQLNELSLVDLTFANENGEWISKKGRKKTKNPSATIQSKEYPDPKLEMVFDQYEIVNTTIGTTILTYEEDIIPPIDTETDEDATDAIVNDVSKEVGIPLGIDFLRGESKEDYREYRTTLIRPIMRMTHQSWKDIEAVEELCTNIFADVQQRRGKIASRLIAYSLILKEVKRRTNPPLRRPTNVA